MKIRKMSNNNQSNLKKLLKKGVIIMKPIESWLTSFKGWVKKAGEFTAEESKVLSIRAKEAAHLTSLNAKKHKVTREYQETCAQIGQQVIGLSKGGNPNVVHEPKVRELISRASSLEKDMKKLEEEAEGYKQECNQEISQVHKKAA